METPRHSRTAEKALANAQRRVSGRTTGRTRRTTGRTRRTTAVRRLATTHQPVRRQRTDHHHHQLARSLLQHYATMYLEDVPVANLVRDRYLAKRIRDAGWAALRTMLACKAAGAGQRVVAGAPAYTSQDGSGGGQRVPKTLSMRTPICPSCGLGLDRDENAASNMHWAGQALRGLAGLPAGMTRAAPCR